MSSSSHKNAVGIAFVAFITLSLVSTTVAEEFRIRITFGASRASVGVVLPETENLPASVVGGSSGGSSGLLPEGDTALLDSLAADLNVDVTSLNDLNFIDFENGSFAFEFDIETETPPTIDEIDKIDTVPLTFKNESGTFTLNVPVDDTEPPIIVSVEDSGMSDVVLAIIIIFSLIGFLLLVALIYFCYKKKKKKETDKVCPLDEIHTVDRPDDNGTSATPKTLFSSTSSTGSRTSASLNGL